MKVLWQASFELILCSWYNPALRNKQGIPERKGGSCKVENKIWHFKNKIKSEKINEKKAKTTKTRSVINKSNDHIKQMSLKNDVLEIIRLLKLKIKCDILKNMRRIKWEK